LIVFSTTATTTKIMSLNITISAPNSPRSEPGNRKENLDLALNGPFATIPSLMEPRKTTGSFLGDLKATYSELTGTSLPKEAESIVKKVQKDLISGSSNYTVNSLGIVTFTANSAEKASQASIDASIATVENYNNNLAWYKNAVLQLATQKDQLSVQKQVAEINASSSDTSLKSLEIQKILMGYTIRNDARQAEIFEYQKYLGTAQTDQYKEANAATRVGLDNQAKALSKQDQQIAVSTQQLYNTVAIAERSYAQADRLSKANIENNIDLSIRGLNNANLNVQETLASNALTAKQNQDFQRAMRLEDAYQDTRLAWNNKMLLEFIDPSKIEYFPGKDGWILRSTYGRGSSEGRERTPVERLTELISVMQSAPRPDFAKLEKKHTQERTALTNKFAADRKKQAGSSPPQASPTDKQPRQKSIYFKDSEIKAHWEVFTANLASGKNRQYFDSSHGAEYADKNKKAGDSKKTSSDDMKLLYRRFEELRTILEVLPPTSTGNSQQMRKAAAGSLDRLHTAPNVQAFLIETNGTVNAFYGK
jgi:hypothetical protein